MSESIREKLRQKELMTRDKNAKTTKFDKVPTFARGGDTISFPADMAPEEALRWTQKWAESEQKVIQIVEDIEGIPIDAAHALQLAVLQEFGFSDLRSTPGFFSDRPPAFLSVPVDHLGNTKDVYVGRMALPGFEDGWIQTWADDEKMCLKVQAQVRQKDQHLFKLLTATARQTLKTESLYKGQAIILDLGKTESDNEGKSEIMLPSFYDVSSRQTIILNEATEKLIEATLWTPIRKAAVLRKMGIPIKRGILLNGTFGTGKTLTARETARIAVENGFTFVYVKEVNQLAKAFEFIRKHYLPAVLFCEDTDRAFEDINNINLIQNTLDGIDTKNCEVITVLTTNYVDKIPVGIIRPGRIDTLITFQAPDAQAAGRLVEFYTNGLLEKDADMVAIGKAVAGNIPAVIREIVERAKLFGLSRLGPNDSADDIVLSSDDIVFSAYGMHQHMALLQRGSSTPPSPVEQFGTAMGATIAKGVAQGVREMVNGMAHHHDDQAALTAGGGK